MIALDYRLHVVQWKQMFHASVGRRLTTDEFQKTKEIPILAKFRRGEEVYDGQYFANYDKNCKNGYRLLSAEAIKAEDDKNRERVRALPASIKKDRYKRGYAKNRQKIISRTALHNKMHPEKYKKHYSKYREEILQRQRERRAKNGEEYNAKVRLYRQSASEEVKKNRKDGIKRWQKANREKVNGYRRKRYHKYKNTKTVPLKRKVVTLIRDRLRAAVDRKLYGRKTDYPTVNFLMWLAEKLGIDINKHEIDHIIPLSRCDLTTSEGQMRANAPENVRWITPLENRAKADTMPTTEDIEGHKLLVEQWRFALQQNSICQPVAEAQV